MSDEDYLRIAINLAQEGMESGAGGPFGALIVKDGQIVGRAYNQVTSTNDPTAHAEVLAIRDACKHLQHFQLDGCTIYSSCEPCPMCLGAIYWARPARLVYACTRADAAKIGFDDDFIYKELSMPAEDRQIKITQSLRAEALAVFESWQHKNDRVKY